MEKDTYGEEHEQLCELTLASFVVCFIFFNNLEYLHTH